MRIPLATVYAALLIAGLLLSREGDLLAQAITTAAIGGSVRAADGSDADGARVTVRNEATGLEVGTAVRDGRFLVRGLDVGGPYSVTVDGLGLEPERRGSLHLALGEVAELAFELRPSPLLADTLRAFAAPIRRIDAHGGPVTSVPDSLIRRLPTLNRNAFDFVVLAPHVSTKVGFQRSGVSGAGANFRYDDFLVNGVSERFVNGSVSAAANLGKSIPLDAVKEYQVLVAPYDVRYGDFAGALVNTVTERGTNDWRGSAFAYWRSDDLARGGGSPRAPYEQLQYGFSLGGPIVRDRVHFFVAPEFQSLTSPAAGPFLGQPATATPPVPVGAADVARMEEILREHGLASGSAGLVENRTPLRNLFGRLDAALPRWNSRAMGFVSYARLEDESFSRLAADTFPLSTRRSTQVGRLRLLSLQLFSDLPVGAHNELLVSHASDLAEVRPEVEQPLVRVLAPGASGGLVTLEAGPPEQAHGRFGRAWSVHVSNELALSPWGDHSVVLGVRAERFRSERGGVVGGYGAWTFSSLDSLASGIADRYQIRRDFGGASAPMSGGQYAAWVGDEWRAADGLVVTLGLRGDLLDIHGAAPYNARVDSLFGRRTDRVPRSRVHLSPRLGFSWDLTSRDRLRGGTGIFTGRPPLAWIHPALHSYGVGIGVLRCGPLATDTGRAPAFVPDVPAAPLACATGPDLTTAPLGDVDLVDPDLRMARSLRASLAWDRELPWALLATGEALVSRHLSDFRFVNLNLEGPQAVDRFGRVLYGTLDPVTGVATPALRSDFSEVIDLRNTARNYSYQLTSRIERRFSRGWALSASYTFSRVRDVQSPSRVNMPGIVLWADAVAVSGRHEEQRRGISLNDLPHRVVVAGTFRAPWDRWFTDVSFTYVGESGSPFTYLAGGASRRGDLNADGSNANDPIYVPRDASDPEEIRFTGLSNKPGADNSPDAQADRIVAQELALERLIERTPCLREQRGDILERNSCREPWSHTTIASVTQSVPIGARALELELAVFNVLNLLRREWGRYRVASRVLLEHVGQSEGGAETAQPIFRYDPEREEWTTLETESAFQIQLAARYRL